MTDAPQPALARANAILASPHAIGRELFARSLAFDAAYAALPAQAALKLLVQAPKGGPATAAAPASEGRPATTGGLSPAEATATWGRAVARVNRRVESKSSLARS